MRLGLFLLLFLNVIDVGNCIDCTLTFPISQLPANCTTMTGDIVINGKNVTTMLGNHLQYSVLLQKFSKIEHWYGSIIIWDTDFKDLAFFQSLLSVETSFPNDYFYEDNINKAMDHAVFWIESNHNLTSLGMPKLVDVFADVLPTVRRVFGLYVNDNAELCMSESEFWKLRKFRRSFLYGMKICGPVTKQYCYSSAFLHTNMPLGCQILLSGIWLRDIRNASIQTYLNQAYSTVEEVHGPIVIFRTDFTNLSFPALHTIRSQYYDGQNDWQWQVLIVRGNYFLTSLDFPKLVNWTHFGREPQLTNSANTIWKYTEANCYLFQQLPFASILDTYSDCGIRPVLNYGYMYWWIILQLLEKPLSFGLHLGLCIYASLKLFKTRISVNFFQFAMVLLILLIMTESLFVNSDFVHIYDNKGFAIPYGLRALFINKDAKLFNQVSNTMYVNRLAFFISCSTLRPLYLMGPIFENVGVVMCGLVFVVANFLNLFVMDALQNMYTYVLFPLNWFTLLVTIISAFIVNYLLKKNHSDALELIDHHNALSRGLFLQALWTFIFCGYSDGTNQFLLRYTQYIWLVRQWDHWFYWYGSLILRWHYLPIVAIMVWYLRFAFVKIPSKTNIVSNRSSTIAFVN